MNARVQGGLVFLTAWVVAVSASEWAPNLRAQGKASTVPSPSDARTLRLPDTPYHYADIDLPAHFKTPAAQKFDNTPPDNPVTDRGATLGRVIFYDTRLSANNTVSCSTCHVQARAFVDPNRFSRGFKDGRTDRHAMNLVNLRYHPRGRFFWDERGGNLEEMVLLPAENTLEMGQDVSKLPAILGRDPKYPELFRAAFGDPEITRERICQGARAVHPLAGLVSVEVRRGPGSRTHHQRRFSQLHASGKPRQGALHAQLRHLPPGEPGSAFHHARRRSTTGSTRTRATAMAVWATSR